jgi:hypothetical protein
VSAQEVVLVNKAEPLGRAFATLIGITVISALLGGWWLMLLLPLLTETAGWPALAPGYWRCVALVALARLLLGTVCGRVRPMESKP